MAQSTLPVPSPDFFHSGVFSQILQSVFIDQQILAVDRVLLAYKRPALDLCQYETPETSYGACDGLPCYATATVFDQETELEYCAKHFQEVSRG